MKFETPILDKPELHEPLPDGLVNDQNREWHDYTRKTITHVSSWVRCVWVANAKAYCTTFNDHDGWYIAKRTPKGTGPHNSPESIVAGPFPNLKSAVLVYRMAFI